MVKKVNRVGCAVTTRRYNTSAPQLIKLVREEIGVPTPPMKQRY